nr:MAG TPA: hypothetical protein [Bacteriophage sp.]
MLVFYFIISRSCIINTNCISCYILYNFRCYTICKCCRNNCFVFCIISPNIFLR